jgi:hypothetical protein
MAERSQAYDACARKGRRLAGVLARNVEITDIHDERSFYDQFARLISQAQNSIWLWRLGRLPRPYPPAPAEGGSRPWRAGYCIRPGPQATPSRRRGTSPKP